MKHIRKISEETRTIYDKKLGKFVFEPADIDDTITFYLHNDNNKTGFAMDIKPEDRSKLEEILNRNKITYTVSSGNVLPF
jgi:hypothetical protein